MPIIEIGLALAALAGLGGATIKSSRDMEKGGGGAHRSQPTPSYLPPQYEPQAEEYSPYSQGGYSQQEQDYSPPADEVRLSPDKYTMFHADVVFEGSVMDMLVDTGAALCAVGPDGWSVIKRHAQNQRSGWTNTASGRVSTTEFTLPYLTVKAKRGGPSITVRDIAMQYIPDMAGYGLLGMSFLSKCEFWYEGNEFVIRG